MIKFTVKFTYSINIYTNSNCVDVQKIISKYKYKTISCEIVILISQHSIQYYLP